MKKIFSLLLLFVCLCASSQYINVRKPLRLVYGGDTLIIYFDIDTVNYESNLSFQKFKDDAIIVDSIQVNGVWYSAFASVSGNNTEIQYNDNEILGASPNFTYSGDGFISDTIRLHDLIIYWVTGDTYYIENLNTGDQAFFTSSLYGFAHGGSSTTDLYLDALNSNSIIRADTTEFQESGNSTLGYFTDSGLHLEVTSEDTSDRKLMLDENNKVVESVNVYAGMYLDSNIVATTITTQDVWYKIGNFTQSPVFENATYTTDTIWIDYDGIYQFSSTCFCGYGETGTEEYEIGISINGAIPLTLGRSSRDLAVDNGSQCGCAFPYRLYDGDYIVVKVANRSGTNDYTFIYGGIMITKLN